MSEGPINPVVTVGEAGTLEPAHEVPGADDAHIGRCRFTPIGWENQ